MKVENLTFNRYATELHLTDLISRQDVLRAQASLEAKGDGFINDLTSLANDIRLGLSRKHFKLSEHTNRVFARIHASVLPRFLGGALRKVFTHDGELREDRCLHTCASLLMFCDSLKRVDPQTHRRPDLEEKLWSGLCDRFSDAPDTARRVAQKANSDRSFALFLWNVRRHFRSVISRADVSRPEFGTGPGKNLDRLDASTSSDWFMKEPSAAGPASRPISLAVYKAFNRVPFKGKRKRHDLYASRVGTYRYGGVALKRPTGIMKCSAQPKSNKALRGVGVMEATRMAEQIALQRIFYRDCLNPHMPLKDQDAMKANLQDNWSEIGTIDLSNASDLLYWYLLHWLGSGIPWFDAAYELRTQELALPTGNIPCAAPVMGEAITFPLLSLTMYSIAMATCDEVGYGHEYVRIYGDDIQTAAYYETIDRLHDCGFRVSVEKSYPPDSSFKESCEAHYVERNGSLRSCRPSYLFSANLNRRNRITHVDTYRLLIIAKDAWMRNPVLSKACCDLIENRTSLKLPLVPFGSTALGRPTLDSKSTTELDVECSKDSNISLSERGALRHILRAVGTDSPNDFKLSRKVEYLMTLRTLKKLQVRDTMRDLENLIMYRVAVYCIPEAVSELESRGCSHQDIKSYLINNCSEDAIVAGLQLMTELLQSVKL